MRVLVTERIYRCLDGGRKASILGRSEERVPEDQVVRVATPYEDRVL